MFIDNTFHPLPPDTPVAALRQAWRLVIPADTPVWDERRNCWKLGVYDLKDILTLQNGDALLDGHPEHDLPEDAWGYLDFMPHEKYRLDRVITAWENGGCYIAVQPYAAQPNKKWIAYRTRRIRLRHLLQRSVLTPEQVTWVEMVCEASHIALQDYRAAQAQPNGQPKKRKKPKKPSRRKKKQRQQLSINNDQ